MEEHERDMQQPKPKNGQLKTALTVTTIAISVICALVIAGWTVLSSTTVEIKRVDRYTVQNAGEIKILQAADVHIKEVMVRIESALLRQEDKLDQLIDKTP